MSKSPELAARLAAARARQAESDRAAARRAVDDALTVATEALQAAGVAFEIVDMGAVSEWLPRWIAWGWGEIPWHLARVPHAERPGEDPAARAAAAAPMLADLVDDGAAPILFIYEDMWVAIRLARDAAIAHMAALMAVAPRYGEMWIVAPPADFIVRVEREWVMAHVAAPLATDVVARQRAANREGRRALAPLRRALVEAGIRARLRYAYDLVSAREHRLGPPRIDWKRADKSLDCAAPDDPGALAQIVAAFVAERAAPDATLRIIVTGESPNIEIPAGAFVAHAGAILAAAGTPLWLTAPDANWVVQIGAKWLYGAD